jgi:hypothetical protein
MEEGEEKERKKKKKKITIEKEGWTHFNGYIASHNC